MMNHLHKDAALSRLHQTCARAGLAGFIILAGAGLGLGASLREASPEHFSPTGFTLRALLLFVVVLALFARALPDHLPHERPGPANMVTLIRLGLTALLAGLIGLSHPPLAWPAVLLATLAFALDGLDGWLARRGGWASRFGARFDMETDALLIALLSVLVWQFDKAGPWILLAGLLRYAFVASATVWPWLRAELAPSWRRKVVCVVQVATLLLALTPLVQRPLSTAVALLGLCALAASFLIDIVWLYRHRPAPHAH